MAAPFIGSFAGVLISRVPAGRGFVADRSRCEACGHGLGVADLVPMASFLALSGKCRYCAAPIPRLTLWAELAALGIAFWAAASGERSALLWAGCLLGWALLTLGWIDALCQRLPDFLTLPLVLTGLAESYFLEPDALTGRALGAAFGYAGFYALALCYKRLRGREGLGQGDAKFLAAGGAWVGAWRLPDLLLVAGGGGTCLRAAAVSGCAGGAHPVRAVSSGRDMGDVVVRVEVVRPSNYVVSIIWRKTAVLDRNWGLRPIG